MVQTSLSHQTKMTSWRSGGEASPSLTWGISDSRVVFRFQLRGREKGDPW